MAGEAEAFTSSFQPVALFVVTAQAALPVEAPEPVMSGDIDTSAGELMLIVGSTARLTLTESFAVAEARVTTGSNVV